jgi:hypothetical protein
MRRVAKLVYWLERHEFIAAGAKDCSVARKGFGIAGDADDKRHRGRCESTGLALGPRAGRITPATIARIETHFHLPQERTEVQSDFHYQSTEPLNGISTSST